MDEHHAAVDGAHSPQYPAPHPANILHIIWYREFWLFALETYFFKVYFMVLVCYICQAYLLKRRGKGARNKQRLAMGIIVGLLLGFETAVFIASVVIENDGTSNINCECTSPITKTSGTSSSKSCAYS